ncbi:MAG: hypothetical protein IPM45_02970 [Acidimicrobiales bacterium]|nr:hypothetical protein [Acidimicrobiales bacterium]
MTVLPDPPPPVEAALLAAAVELAEQAGALALRWFRSPDLTVTAKGDGTPVTQADREAEHLVRSQLAHRFPADTILGEEEGLAEGTSTRRWILDPVDGTLAFSRGVPTFSTLLAVHDEHGPAVGVIVLPALGETVAAGRGLGCSSNGVPVQVSERDEVRGSTLSTSGFDHWPEPALIAVRRAGWRMRTWGDGWGYALVATGRIDAMVDPDVSPWDLAPMPVILAEAGGRFTAADGRDGIDRGSGVATNGRLHDTLLAQLAGG